MSDESDKKVIGLYGEMRLSMELHKRGWQVYRAYIDEKFDFVIMKCYCDTCECFRNAWQRAGSHIPPGKIEKSAKIYKTVTNLCEHCKSDSLRMLIRFIQVKTSEGKNGKSEIRKYSFHPKIRYHLADGRVYYTWIQVWDDETVNFYIFHTSEVKNFDNLDLPTYQVTDNQKTTLRISKDGVVHNKSKYDYSVFERSLNHFEIFDELTDDERSWYPSQN